MKKITLFMSLLVLMIVGLQARAADVYVATDDPTFNVYTWNPEQFGGWPGTLITEAAQLTEVDGTQYYKMTVEGTGRFIIFNKDGVQTQNILLQDGDNFFTYPVNGDFSQYETTNPAIEITSYTVAGGAALMGVDWDPTATQNDMTLQDDGTYKLVKEGVQLAAGGYEYKVVGNHAWSIWEVPMQGNQTLDIAEDGKYNVTFTLTLGEQNVLTAEAEKIEEQPVEITSYTIVGDSALVGAAWNPELTANDMVLQEDGTYKLVKENVELEAKGYEYKVTANHTWQVWEVPVQGNQTLDIAEAGKYNVTFTLTLGEENVLAAVAEKVEDQPVEITSYTIVGDSALVGAAWNPELTANDMVLQEDGTYKLVKENVELEAKGYEYKVTANHTWQVWEVPVQGNQTLDIAEAGKYNVTFTLTLGEENVLAAVAEKVEDQPVEITSYTIVGDSALLGAAWNPELTANDMALQEDGTYKLVKENVELETKGYEYKVTANHTWQVWEVPMQGNQTLDIAEAGKYNVTFTLTLGEENVLAAVAEKVEDQPVEITSYTIVGDSALLGAAWNPELTANDMALQEDGTYKLVKENLELEAKGYEYKVTANHTWQVWEVPMQGNQTLDIAEAGKYNVTFTLTLGEENVLAAVAEKVEDQPVEITSYTIVGDSALVGAAWNPELTANDMVLQEDGTYKLVKENVELEAKGYEYKVTANHTWQVWEVPMQGNQTLDIAEAGKYNVTFTLTLGEENVLAAVAEKVEEQHNYVLHYGLNEDGAEWSQVEFADNDGKLQATAEFAENTEFVISYGDVWYGGAGGGENYLIHSEWCNDIPLVTENKVNFHINEAGTYTFTLTVGEEGITMDVEGFEPKPEPKYVLHYGLNEDGAEWSQVEFADNDGKLQATAEFTENTEFVINYGDLWYGGQVASEEEAYYLIHAGWCTDIPLATENKVNFHINEAGTYTFVLTVGEEGIIMDVKGFAGSGDITGDGTVDIADVNAVINMMLGKVEQTAAGDVTGDGTVDIADVNAVINIMLGK